MGVRILGGDPTVWAPESDDPPKKAESSWLEEKVYDLVTGITNATLVVGSVLHNALGVPALVEDFADWACPRETTKSDSKSSVLEEKTTYIAKGILYAFKSEASTSLVTCAEVVEGIGAVLHNALGVPALVEDIADWAFPRTKTPDTPKAIPEDYNKSFISNDDNVFDLQEIESERSALTKEIEGEGKDPVVPEYLDFVEGSNQFAIVPHGDQFVLYRQQELGVAHYYETIKEKVEIWRELFQLLNYHDISPDEKCDLKVIPAHLDFHGRNNLYGCEKRDGYYYIYCQDANAPARLFAIAKDNEKLHERMQILIKKGYNQCRVKFPGSE